MTQRQRYPPYILRRIIESGSEPQQRCARQT
jgi:hypothetical protein